MSCVILVMTNPTQPELLRKQHDIVTWLGV